MAAHGIREARDDRCREVGDEMGLEKGIVVTVFPDGAEKYLNESFWSAND